MTSPTPRLPVISLRNLPVNLFAAVMSISGLALAWRCSAHQFHTPIWISHGIGLVAVVVFFLLSIAYLAKILKHPEVVKNEFNHPIAGNFFGTFNIAVLLLSAVISPYGIAASKVVWTLGSIGTVALGFTIVSRLFRGKIDAGHAVPAWLIPGVATLDITVAGGTMPMAWARELNLFALAVGTIVALVFFTMIVSRLIHHHEGLATGMVPSLMILIAPFEVGFQAYTNFTRKVDDFAAMLFYSGLFLFLILVFKVFRRSIPFAAGWWAVGFPLAALANSALKYAAAVQLWPLDGLAIALLAFLSLVIVVLFIRTLHIILNGSLLRA
ncbi:MAG: C4-dicarboxylate transporter [Akkermansiaceae bacterium]|nr:C4-dicarboxylate transporter [Akkermansiaceae bacterium]